MAELEARGIPAVGVATEEFIEGAKAQARSLGTDPALVVIPHPVQVRTDAELHKLANDHFEPIVRSRVTSRDRLQGLRARLAVEPGVPREPSLGKWWALDALL